MSVWKKALRTVDWSSLDHACGEAGNVPGLVEQMAKGDEEAWDAWEELDSSVLHQGQVYPAAVPVVEAAAGMIVEGVEPELPLRLIRSAAEGVEDGLGDPEVLAAMRVALDQAVPALITTLRTGGESAAEAADIVAHLGLPGPELTAALIDALDTREDVVWAAARTLGYHGLFPGSDDPALAVPAALGRLQAGKVTDEDVVLVAAHTDLVAAHDDVAELSCHPRGVEVLLRMEPSRQVLYGLRAAAESSRSVTPVVATRIIEALTKQEEVDEITFDLLLQLPRTPEVLDAIDLLAPRFVGEEPVEHPCASAACALARAGDPRWEVHAAAVVRWALEHRDDLERTELYSCERPGVSSPLGTALAEVGAVPGEELAGLLGEALTVLDPQDKEFTWRSVARWMATWPPELQKPWRAVAKRKDPFNPHWAETEADLQHIRDEAVHIRDLIPLARYTGSLEDWLTVLSLSQGAHDSDIDAEFPQRDHPQLVAWWQGILETSDHGREQVAALKGLVEASAMPFEEGWQRVVALIEPQNLFVAEAAQLAAAWSDRVDQVARAELLERLATVLAEAEWGRTECGVVLVQLGGRWPLGPEETVRMVVRELLRNWQGVDQAVALCAWLREQEPGIAELLASRLRVLVEGDGRLVCSILDDEEKQADLRRVLAALEDAGCEDGVHGSSHAD
ncbi:MAG: hypothetical protein Q4D96_13755 [Propionibacteriaceae bacterium]|nr:hypothetical protein [Propionibacteriaceae bacterium]